MPRHYFGQRLNFLPNLVALLWENILTHENFPWIDCSTLSESATHSAYVQEPMLTMAQHLHVAWVWEWLNIDFWGNKSPSKASLHSDILCRKKSLFCVSNMHFGLYKVAWWTVLIFDLQEGNFHYIQILRFIISPWQQSVCWIRTYSIHSDQLLRRLERLKNGSGS